MSRRRDHTECGARLELGILLNASLSLLTEPYVTQV